MKKQIFRLLALLLITVMSVSLAACEIDDKDDNPPSVGPSPSYGIIYHISSDLCTDKECGRAVIGQEIPITVRFFQNSVHPNNVRVTVLESEYYEIVGQTEFNILDYNPDENGYIDIVFTVKIIKETQPKEQEYPTVRGIGLRFTCLCEEEDCGRFREVSAQDHYYDATMAFGFVAYSDKVFLSYNHSMQGFNEYILYSEAKGE